MRENTYKSNQTSSIVHSPAQSRARAQLDKEASKTQGHATNIRRFWFAAASCRTPGPSSSTCWRWRRTRSAARPCAGRPWACTGRSACCRHLHGSLFSSVVEVTAESQPWKPPFIVSNSNKQSNGSSVKLQGDERLHKRKNNKWHSTNNHLFRRKRDMLMSNSMKSGSLHNAFVRSTFIVKRKEKLQVYTLPYCLIYIAPLINTRCYITIRPRDWKIYNNKFFMAAKYSQLICFQGTKTKPCFLFSLRKSLVIAACVLLQ